MEGNHKIQMVKIEKKLAIVSVIILAIAVSLLVVFTSDKSIIKAKPLIKPSLIFNDKENLRYEMKNRYIILPTQSNKFFKRTEIDLNTTFEIVVFKENDTVYLGMQFDKFIMSVKSNKKTQIVEPDKNVFEPFLITLYDGAKVDNILFSNKLNENAQGEITGFIQTLQIAFKKDTSKWTDHEENRNGTYETKYSVSINKQNIIDVHKENVKFLSVSSDGADIEILSSKITSQIDNKSWLKNLNFEEKSLYGANDKPMMRAKGESNLKRIPNINKKMQLLTFSTAQELRAYLKASAKIKQSTPLDLLTPKEAIKSFFKCMEIGKCNFLTIKKNLINYLVQNPENFHIVLDMIKDEKYAEFHHRLINMLRDIGTPEAQKAMIELISSDEFTTSNRTQASIQIGFLSEPTFDTIESIKQLRASGILERQQQMTTYLALGNLASRSQEAYEQIAPDLISDLQTSSSTEDTVAALSALENTENNDIIDKVTPYLVSPNIATRRGAVEALRLTPAPEATQALHEQVKVETYDLVVNSIAYSLHNKKDLTPEIIKDVAMKITQKIKNSNDTMMKKSIDFLVEKSKTNQDAQNALKEMMGKNLSIEAKRRIIRGL